MKGIVHGLARELPDSVTAVDQLPPEAVARVLDESTLLALPSRSEGTPRVVMEAFTRGRAVVASPVGGIPDLIVSGRNGLLVPPERSEDIAEALIRVMRDSAYAAMLGAGAYASSHEFELLPERFAEEVASLMQLLAREA
jgi:glycosyltransferase involved in cell wall biosynthesis